MQQNTENRFYSVSRQSIAIGNAAYPTTTYLTIAIYDRSLPAPFGSGADEPYKTLATYFESDFCCSDTLKRWVANRLHLLNIYGWNSSKGEYLHRPKYPTDLPPICDCEDWKHTEGWKNSSGAAIPFTPENLVGKTFTLPSLPVDAAMSDLMERVRTLERAYEHLQKKE